MAELFYEDDADLSIIQGRKLAVIGYGQDLSDQHILKNYDNTYP